MKSTPQKGQYFDPVVLSVYSLGRNTAEKLDLTSKRSTNTKANTGQELKY